MQRRTLKQKFLYDKNGRFVLWQSPNIPLYGWIVCKLLSYVLTSGTVHNGLASLGTAFLFTWAFLELAKGVTYFRRCLGLIVMTSIVLGFFS